ncbi:hypothetical protein X744_17005 [Mesorhizobium sp. LNJC372A00]|nr:hypothetical protein X745_22495 [Mesorhizobium sp. LNJC374B00]ESY58759.1 hypothetical protein X744_17005 [Mesorhizobium sp. LNJC372A00]
MVPSCSSKISLAFAAVLHAEPVRCHARLRKAEPAIPAAAGMFARMVVDAPSIARGPCHAFGKP